MGEERGHSDLKTLGNHGFLVLVLLVTDAVLKFVVHRLRGWGIVPDPYATVIDHMLNLFVVFVIIIFSVSALLILVSNARASVQEAKRGSR